MKRSLFLFCVTAALLLSACQTEDPSHELQAPAFESLSEPRIVALQDSLMHILPPDSFIVRFSGDPRNPDIDAALLRIDGLQGAATYTSSPATDDSLHAMRFTLESHTRSVVHLDVETDTGLGVVLGDTLLVRQRADVPTTSSATFSIGRHRFSSRSGWLKLAESTDGHLRGSFYYALKSPELREEDWFQLVGVFDVTKR